jgi:hypothetical protein
VKCGKFTAVLKVGKITPVYNKCNPEELGNYRPVSTLPIFNKIIEKILLVASVALQSLKTYSTKINLALGNHTQHFVL